MLLVGPVTVFFGSHRQLGLADQSATSYLEPSRAEPVAKVADAADWSAARSPGSQRTPARLPTFPTPESPLPPTAVKDEAVVTLKDGTRIEEIAKQYNAQVTGSISNLNAHRLRFNDPETAASARAALAADSQVASVGLNYSVERPSTPEALGPAGDSAVSLKVTRGESGGHTVIGLIDTAVQPQAAGISDFVLESQSLADTGSSSATTLTHGTSMAETLLQGLTQVVGEQGSSTTRILTVDVYGASETTTTYQVAEGVAKAVASGATVINLSLGTEADSPVLQQVIADAHAQGIIFVAAAGNTPDTSATYPAAYSEVVAVTATDDQGNIASYANRGSFVDVAAPGSVIVTFDGQAYQVTGTSAATALVSGIAAGLLEKKHLTSTQAEELIRAGLAPKASR